LLGPMLITAYHFGFIVPQMRDLLHSHIELRNVRNELIQEREQRRKELERSQTLLRNLTAPTRSKVRKDVTGRFIYDQKRQSANVFQPLDECRQRTRWDVGPSTPSVS